MTATFDRPAAEANEYVVRIWCDGEELAIPMRIHAAKDYGIGDDLEAVATQQAVTMLNTEYGIAHHSCRVAIFPVPEAEGTEACDGDLADLIPLAAATVEYAQW